MNTGFDFLVVMDKPAQISRISSGFSARLATLEGRNSIAALSCHRGRERFPLTLCPIVRLFRFQSGSWQDLLIMIINWFYLKRTNSSFQFSVFTQQGNMRIQSPYQYPFSKYIYIYLLPFELHHQPAKPIHVY